MAFERNTVSTCPHARGTQGVVVVATDVIAQLAHAVWEKEEWLCLLKGTRSEGGLLVEVDSLDVPYSQDRGLSDCSFKDYEIPRGVVGCLHSHSAMGAFFSVTDYAKFNTKFGLSIVIAQPDRGKSNTAPGDAPTLMGFDYLAEGKFKLPCGSLGVCDFKLRPDAEDWPFPVTFNKGLKDDYIYIGDCDRYEVSEADSYYIRYKGACGLEDSDKRVRRNVFGKSDQIVKLLPPPTPPKVYKGKALPKPGQTLGGSYQDYYNKGWSSVDDDEDDFYGYGLPVGK